MLLIIIFVIPLYAIPLDFPCYDETWTYSNLTGKCYKPILGAQKLTFSDASYACKIHLQNISEVSINLIQFFDEDEANAVVDLLSRNGFKETIWIGANRSDAKQPFVWYTDGSTALFSYIDWSEGTNSGNCIEFSYSTQPIPGTDKWSVTKIVDNKPCDLTRSFICEHKVPLCTNPQGGFNSTTMIFKPPIMAPRSVVQVLCAPGTLPDPIVPGSRLSGFEVDLSLPRGSYKCTGKRFNNNPNSEDPLKFQPQLFYSGYSLTTCSYVKCPLYPELMENIENKPQVPVGSDSLIYDYGQNITLQCSRGYVSFQNPNSTLATMICAQASATFNQGLWDPENYQACIEATCLYEQAVIQPDSNMQPYFIVMKSTIDVMNLTKHSGDPYPRGTVIRYFCKDGYESINQNSELNITCGNYGQWTPQLIGCIARIEKVPVSLAGRFYSPPEEAESASKLSSIMFIMVFIFLGLILLLDLATIGRDFKQIRSNIKLQKRRLNHLKNKSKVG
ncbi:Sushi/SCR/CCP,domain-containing protein isoform 1 [Schistosoma japonicum]|uniref:Sushi/SCR/CCP,domain-containing protein isoform 1 n=1 Tax=Schistosoma japonicum TaxID=6182 RepID=A0A4Z2D6B9_SCHJA|nr:Sushi/SCR/CCP domain-containing protein [Schistosoma japonicum]TNN12021.1 Sushi/SCR/CCP,domain-containing protein isoform 1 [Schistosoma japonicum]